MIVGVSNVKRFCLATRFMSYFTNTGRASVAHCFLFHSSMTGFELSLLEEMAPSEICEQRVPGFVNWLEKGGEVLKITMNYIHSEMDMYNNIKTVLLAMLR